MDAAARQILDLMEPGDDALREERKRAQLRELALLNGTVRVRLSFLHSVFCAGHVREGPTAACTTGMLTRRCQSRSQGAKGHHCCADGQT